VVERRFAEPGTHMVAVRADAQRSGDPDGWRVTNLARVRLVVT
jgi:hypothetical protein